MESCIIEKVNNQIATRLRLILLLLLLIIKIYIIYNLEPASSVCMLYLYYFYVRRYLYALLISLKCSWASDFDILFVVGSYLSGWYILERHQYCTLIYFSVAAVDTDILRIPRESFLLCPTFVGS